MRFRITEIERIDDEPNVGGILARLAHMRNFDQLEIGLVHGPFETLVAIPVAIRLLDDDAALQQQALEYKLDIELVVFRVAHAKRDILEVAEQRHADVFVG
ncbi:hypothetical protein HDG41_002974 [Paraburkholderia sp. JPY162]|uniref:Uncharacterized protein n=1 Tax=Paraburkholderia youngii TaxID=2782701 RepID=A0A7W8P168_9BURK|nr:hypothetical protein [Paraburkholderia youngii]